MPSGECVLDGQNSWAKLIDQVLMRSIQLVRQSWKLGWHFSDWTQKLTPGSSVSIQKL